MFSTNLYNTVINNEDQSRQCLGLDSNDRAPLPVDLKSISDDANNVCQNRTPPYVFYCTVRGNDQLWIFNNHTEVTDKFLFQPSNQIGQTINKTFNEAGLLYNITAVLILVSKDILSDNVSLPICSSVLMVTPLNKSNFEVLPHFMVSCQTHCQSSLNYSPTCQSTLYDTAAGMYYVASNLFACIY